MPASICSGAHLSRRPSITSSCLRNHSANNPLATVSLVSLLSRDIFDRYQLTRLVRMQIRIPAAPTAKIVHYRTEFDQKVGFTGDLCLDNNLCGFESNAQAASASCLPKP